MIVYWIIWKNRNCCLHDMYCRNSKSILMLAEKMRLDYNVAVAKTPKDAPANKE